jgi:hypothetical protein
VSYQLVFWGIVALHQVFWFDHLLLAGGCWGCCRASAAQALLQANAATTCLRLGQRRTTSLVRARSNPTAPPAQG